MRLDVSAALTKHFPITATDLSAPTVTGTQGFLVRAAQADHFITSAPATTIAGKAFSITLTGLDACSNVAATNLIQPARPTTLADSTR